MTRDGAMWLAAVLGALALVQSARLYFRDASTRWRMRARARRAAAGERAAEPLLRREGYRILERQARASLEYALDGAPVAVEVRADLLVERGGRRWVAEVKTGERAPRLSTRATRRQLLEYGHAFDAAGVLLVDPEAGKVSHVALPHRGSPTPRHGRELGIFALGLALGGLVAAALLASR